MDSYKFKARRRSGDIVLGTINAADASAVSSYVRNQGLIVTQISKVEDKQYFWSRWIKQKVTLYDLSVFCRQFTTLIAAGVSLITALDVLQEQTVNKELKKYIGNIAQDVHTGSSLSEAMARYPRIFPPLMINMIAAGETGGILETVLTRLATQYEKDYRLNQKIKNAFVYPAVVLTVAAIAVAVILTFVMPIFTDLFKALNTELPWPTRILMSISDFLKRGVSWLFIGLVVLGLYTIYKKLITYKEFLLWRDRLLLKLPVFGKLYNYIVITRFASIFAGLSKSGVPILEALAVVSKATGSIQTEEVLKRATGNVREGRGLSEPMKESGLFPPMVINMVSIGEESGSLDFMLDKVADFYGSEVEDMSGRLQTLLEPFLILILGVIIGFIGVALLMPMFDMVTKVGNL